ncbi:MAG TPA: DUF2726 domain-containing protein [Opitutaceae bacterium]|nr:DUF2726 domain-containing protein [Opitutaceae bacterium]
MNPLPLLLIVAVVLVAIAIIVGLLKAKLGNLSPPEGALTAYELRKSIFSHAERSFAGVLDGALPEGVTWLAKVRLGDVFKTRKGLTASESATARNRIDRKHVDFLLVRSSDLAPLVGVELDDSSHEGADRKQRDAFVDDLFRSCALPILHVPAQAAYNQTELRAKIAAALGSPPLADVK